MARATVAAVIGLAIASGPARAEGLEWSAFGNVSPFAGFDMPADGHGPSAKGIVELGLGGAVETRAGRFDVGMGLTYDTGDEGSHRLHFIAAPLRLGFAAIRGTRHGLLLRAEAGPGIGLAPGYGDGVPRGALWLLGAGAAVGIGYRVAISESRAIVVDAGIRFDMLPELNASADSYLRNHTLLHWQLPFVRVGFAMR